MKIQVQLFGGFRQFSSASQLEFEVESALTPKELKVRIQQVLGSAENMDQLSALLSASVLASEDSILQSEEKIASSCRLAILPPVCGG